MILVYDNIYNMTYTVSSFVYDKERKSFRYRSQGSRELRVVDACDGKIDVLGPCIVITLEEVKEK